MRKPTNGGGYNKDLSFMLRVRLTKDQAKELWDFCEKNKVSASQVVRLGIRNYIHAK